MKKKGKSKKSLELRKKMLILITDKEKELIENEEMCEKVFVVPNYMKDNTNAGIENDITTKLEAKGIKVRKVFVQRVGNPTRGEYYRSIVLIEPWRTKAIKESEFGIEKCWVLPSK